MSDETAEGWAGGVGNAAAKAEIERLKKLGEGLRDLTAAAAEIRDPADLAAVQDKNLKAFEQMTAQMGLTALERMRETLAALSDPTKTAELAKDAADRHAALLSAARAEIEATRDQETAKLLRRFSEQMRAAAGGEKKDKT